MTLVGGDRLGPQELELYAGYPGKFCKDSSTIEKNSLACLECLNITLYKERAAVRWVVQ